MIRLFVAVAVLPLLLPTVEPAYSQEFGKVYYNAEQGLTWWERATNRSSWLRQKIGVRYKFNRSVAVIVAISEYTGDFENLASPERDAQRVKEFLLDEAGFDEVWMLVDDEATSSNINTLMTQTIPSVVGPDDRLLVYWSGHGGSAQDANDRPYGFLALQNATSDGLRDTIHMDEARFWLRRIKARQVLFVIDACYSGLSMQMATSPKDPPWEQVAGPGHHILTSSSIQQVSYGYTDGSGGLFTTAFLEGARGAADFNKDGIATVTEIAAHLETQLSRAAAGFGFVQTPQFGPIGRQEGRFFFLSGFQPTPEPKPESEGGQVETYGILRKKIWTTPEMMAGRSESFGDWIAFADTVDGEHFCFLRSDGVDEINSYIDSGRSSLNKLLPYKDGRSGVLGVLFEKNPSNYRIAYLNGDFSEIIPIISSNFDVDVLDIWPSDEKERSLNVKSFGLVDVEISIRELKSGNIVRVIGYRDANNPIVKKEITIIIASLKRKYGENFTEVVFGSLITERIGERILANLSQMLEAPSLEGGIRTELTDLGAARERIIGAFESDTQTNHNLSELELDEGDLQSIDPDVLKKQEAGASINVDEIVRSMSDNDVTLIFQIAEAYSKHPTFVDRMSLFGFSNALAWLSSNCEYSISLD